MLANGPPSFGSAGLESIFSSAAVKEAAFWWRRYCLEVLSCSRGTCRTRLGALTYPRDGPLRQTSRFRCFLNITSLRVVWRKFHHGNICIQKLPQICTLTDSTNWGNLGLVVNEKKWKSLHLNIYCGDLLESPRGGDSNI